MMRRVFAGLLWGIAMWAQTPSPVLSDAQALQLYERAVQLMESSGVAIPDLARAGAPLAENARNAVLNLKTYGAGNAEAHYRFLSNLRAFLLVSDSVPKPNPFPAETRSQLAELRDSSTQTEAYFQALLERLSRQVRDPDRDNLKRYQEINGRVPPPNPAKPRVVFLGDSITDSWRLNEYFPDQDFINRGISGQTTGQMLGRFKADVIDLKPAAVLILAGTNDIARGVTLPVIQNNLAMMVDLAQTHKVKPILATLLPISDYHRNENPSFERSLQRPPQVIRNLNDWMLAFAKARNLTVVNYYQALIDPQGYLKADLARDGLHPDAPGYRLMAPLALEAIQKSVAAPPPPQPPAKKRRLS